MLGNYLTCFLRCKCPGIAYVNQTGRRLDDRLNVHQLDVIKKKVAPLFPRRFSSRDHRL